MPAGVRVQQLTPVVRTTGNQPTTIVRLMSPATSTIRPGTGQQQIIQLNTTKQQQPLVIKAITANRQQPILITSNAQSKTITGQNQPQLLVLNQGQQQKFTLQVATNDHNQTAPPNNNNNNNNNIPQLDGAVDDQVGVLYQNKSIELKNCLF